MKVVRVTYTAAPGYVAQNEKNIQAVMADLQQLQQPGLSYHACLGADGKTFTHTAFFEPAETEKVLFALESFKRFQEQLKASGPETPPKVEQLTLVGSSSKIV